MNQVSYGQAWHLWMSGQLPGGTELFGFSVFWWGRLGKRLVVVSGLIVVLDLVRESRLRAFGAPEMPLAKRVLFMERGRTNPFQYNFSFAVSNAVVGLAMIAILTHVLTNPGTTIVAKVVWIAATLVGALIAWIIVLLATRAVQVALARTLAKPRPQSILRWCAFALFLIGSHFDLLSS